MIACYRCNKGVLARTSPSEEELRRLLREDGTVLWVDLESPGSEESEILDTVFGFHPLAIEDCLERHHAPKVDDFRRYLFIIARAIVTGSVDYDLEFPELGIFLGSNYLVTVHQTPLRLVTDLEALARRNPSETLGQGPDRLLAALLDDIVDRYLTAMEAFDERIAGIEDEVFGNPTVDTLNRLFRLKRGILGLRRVLGPQREMLRRLGREAHPLVTEEHRIYFWDIYDHLVRLAELMEYYRDLISGALDAYLSVISNRTNAVMKTLTVIATIMMPLTLLASIYGMNFRVMPWLDSPAGFHATLAVMGVIACVMLATFKIKKWF